METLLPGDVIGGSRRILRALEASVLVEQGELSADSVPWLNAGNYPDDFVSAKAGAVIRSWAFGNRSTLDSDTN